MMRHIISSFFTRNLHPTFAHYSQSFSVILLWTQLMAARQAYASVASRVPLRLLFFKLAQSLEEGPSGGSHPRSTLPAPLTPANSAGWSILLLDDTHTRGLLLKPLRPRQVECFQRSADIMHLIQTLAIALNRGRRKFWSAGCSAKSKSGVLLVNEGPGWENFDCRLRVQSRLPSIYEVGNKIWSINILSVVSLAKDFQPNRLGAQFGGTPGALPIQVC